jgi:uncharacterized membrane protein (UPF0127 family)
MAIKKHALRVQSLRNQTLIADKCVEANSFLDRLRGLIGRKKLEQGEGMLFPRCNDIHMWFMSIPIDVIFLRRTQNSPHLYQVTSARSRVRPWRPLPLRDGQASDTLELPVGTIERCDLREGDELCIE